jgi:hypothetical protein
MPPYAVAIKMGKSLCRLNLLQINSFESSVYGTLRSNADNSVAWVRGFSSTALLLK